jgi:hypothetical protein
MEERRHNTDLLLATYCLQELVDLGYEFSQPDLESPETRVHWQHEYCWDLTQDIRADTYIHSMRPYHLQYV